MGKPAGNNVAAEVSLSEKDFHALLDKDLGASQAIIQGRIKISGGMSGIKNAQKLVSNFIKPYMIDTWSEAEQQKAAEVDSQPVDKTQLQDIFQQEFTKLSDKANQLKNIYDQAVPEGTDIDNPSLLFLKWIIKI